MTITPRDILFILANIVIGGLIATLVRGGLLREDGALPPLMLIFVAMGLFEFAAGSITRTPLGQFVAMPIRLAALLAAFATYMLVLKF
jgi:hypothetical protein